MPGGGGHRREVRGAVGVDPERIRPPGAVRVAPKGHRLRACGDNQAESRCTERDATSRRPAPVSWVRVGGAHSGPAQVRRRPSHPVRQVSA